MHKNVALRKLYSNISNRQAELMARSLPKRASLPGVEHIVVVASGMHPTLATDRVIKTYIINIDCRQGRRRQKYNIS